MTPAHLTATQRATLALFERGTPLTTAEVADRLDIGRRSAYERLDRLVEHELLVTKKVGASGRVWWDPSGRDAMPADAVDASERSDPSPETQGAHERELQRYASIIDAIGEPVYELDAGGRITFVNEPFVTYSGYTEAELLGSHVTMGMDERDVDRTTAKIVELLAAGGDGTATLEYEVVTKSGVRLPAENRLTLLRDDDGTIRGSAGALWDVSERVERNQELERQRKRLAVLNELHSLVSSVTHGVIDQETRAGIETAVCERAVGAVPYRFAWIAEFHVASGRLDLKAQAASDDGEAGEDRGQTNGEMPTPNDVAVTALSKLALETGTVQTSRIESSRPVDAAGTDGVSWTVSVVVVIPIVYEETTYGVLAMVADRATSFDDEERAVIGHLGQVIGHAIAAVDRKQALMGDVLVELQFRVADFFDSLGVDGSPPDQLTLDHVVPVGDERYLAHGRTTEVGIDGLEVIVDEQPGWDDLRVRGSGSDVRFSFTLGATPVLSTLAAVGGRLQGVVVENGDVRLTVHLTPETDARRLIDAVRAAFPGAELLTHRQIVGSEQRLDWLDGGLPATLTDRQRTTLEVATHAGYFEWPRAATGSEVAAMIGIAPPTFYQHLRRAERKVFESLVTPSTTP